MALGKHRPVQVLLIISEFGDQVVERVSNFLFLRSESFKSFTRPEIRTHFKGSPESESLLESDFLWSILAFKGRNDQIFRSRSNPPTVGACLSLISQLRFDMERQFRAHKDVHSAAKLLLFRNRKFWCEFDYFKSSQSFWTKINIWLTGFDWDHLRAASELLAAEFGEFTDAKKFVRWQVQLWQLAEASALKSSQPDLEIKRDRLTATINW